MKRLSLGSAVLVPLFRRLGQEPSTAVKQVYSTLYSEVAPSLPAVEFADGVLSLGIRSAAWRKEGERMAESLIAGMNHVLGKSVVQRIEFVPWKRVEKKQPSRKLYNVSKPSEELLAASQRIANESVRNAFVRFGKAVEAGRDGREL